MNCTFFSASRQIATTLEDGCCRPSCDLNTTNLWRSTFSPTNVSWQLSQLTRFSAVLTTYLAIRRPPCTQSGVRHAECPSNCAPPPQHMRGISVMPYLCAMLTAGHDTTTSVSDELSHSISGMRVSSLVISFPVALMLCHMRMRLYSVWNCINVGLLSSLRLGDLTI